MVFDPKLTCQLFCGWFDDAVIAVEPAGITCQEMNGKHSMCWSFSNHMTIFYHGKMAYYGLYDDLCDTHPPHSVPSWPRARCGRQRQTV